MIFCLIIVLFLLLIFNYVVHNREIVSPSIVFTFGFLFASLFALAYYKEYDLNLDYFSVFLLILGITMFSFSCFLFKNKANLNDIEKEKFKPKYLILNSQLVFIFMLFSILSLIFSTYQIVKSVGGSITNIGPALYKYRNLTAFNGIDVGVSPVVDIVTGIMHTSAYWFLFVLINNFIISKRLDWKLIIIVLVCGLSFLLDGARAGFLNFLLSFVFIIIVVKFKNSNLDKKNKIKFKYVMIGLLLSFIMIFGLKSFAQLLGRNDTNNISNKEYIGMYTGACIKNFDLFITDFYENGNKIENKIGVHTFKGIYSLFGVDITNLKNNLTFNYVNGNNLGNVYTIFFDFISDGGVFGLIVLSFFMGGVCQFFYNKSKYSNYSKKFFNIPILIYSFMFGGIFFSYFGDQFTSSIISIGFVRYIIMWYILNVVFLIKTGNDINKNNKFLGGEKKNEKNVC